MRVHKIDGVRMAKGRLGKIQKWILTTAYLKTVRGHLPEGWKFCPKVEERRKFRNKDEWGREIFWGDASRSVFFYVTFLIINKQQWVKPYPQTAFMNIAHHYSLIS